VWPSGGYNIQFTPDLLRGGYRENNCDAGFVNMGFAPVVE
jgi:hypothetical protein